MRRSIGVAVLALVILTGAVVPKLVGGNKAPTHTQSAVEHDFGDKVLLLYIRRGPQASDLVCVYFEKVQLRRLGDRYFFVGQSSGTNKPGQPLKGLNLWLPLSDVAQIMEYDNMEAAKKTYEALKKPEGAKKTEGKDALPPRQRDGN